MTDADMGQQNAAPQPQPSGVAAASAPLQQRPQNPFELPPSHDPDIPEKFRGKSMKEIVEIYKNLESAYGKSQQDKKLLSDAVQMVQGLVYFDEDEKALKLHDDNIRMYGVGKLGLVDPMNAQQQQQQQQQMQGQGISGNGAPPSYGNRASDNELWDTDPRRAMMEAMKSPEFAQFLQNAVNPMFNEAYKNSVAPWIKEMQEEKAKNWVKQIKQEFPDFDNMKEQVHKIIEEKGQPVRDYKDLRDAVLLHLARSGELIDRRKSEADIKALEDTIGVLNPRALQKPMSIEDEMTAPIEKLFGVTPPRNTEQARVNQVLFGSPYAPPDS